MKKVFHIKFCTHFFRNGGISDGFIENGWEVDEFDWMEAKRLRGVEKMRMMVVREAEISIPNLIFIQCQVGGVFDKFTVEKPQSIAPTVIFNFDARLEEQMEWMYELNKIVTHCFYSNEKDIGNCHKRGISNCSVLQSSCDPKEYYPIPKDPSLGIPPIVFIGTKTSNFPLSKERVEMVGALSREFGDKFKAYGVGFSEGFIDVKREREIYSNAKICISHNQFNFSPYYKNYDSDRKWRIMAIGKSEIKRNDYSTIDEFISNVGIDYYDINRGFVDFIYSNRFKEDDSYGARVRQLESEFLHKYGLKF